MKRFWFALALLLLLFTASMVAIWYFSQVSRDVVEVLKSTCSYVEEGNVQEAAQCFYEGKKRWEQERGKLHYFLNRTELGEVEELLSSCEALLQRENIEDFFVECKKAVLKMESLFSEESPTVENLF